MQDNTGKVKKVVRDKLQRFYSNQHRIEISTIDASIVFAQSEYQVDENDTRMHVVTELAKISFTIDALRGLADVLQQTLNQHDKNIKEMQSSKEH